MKDRITKTKAILDLAQNISQDADVGILLVSSGLNGVLSAGCASILEMAYRNEGEEAGGRPSIIQFVAKMNAQTAFLVVDAARDAAKGSLIVVESDKVEIDAEVLRELVANTDRHVLVSTCHS